MAAPRGAPSSACTSGTTSPTGWPSPSSPRGPARRPAPPTAPSTCWSAGLDLRYAFYGQRDRNGYERFFVYAHARGGYLVSHPTGLFGDTDVLVGGGLGVEYYTQLRHFSVGLQVDGLYVLSAKAPGFAVTPVVRYTF